VFLLCQEYDPCSLYLGAMIMGMGAATLYVKGCGYGSHMGIDAATLYSGVFTLVTKSRDQGNLCIVIGEEEPAGPMSLYNRLQT
jgi:hypothetical protein